jgi:1L-myo-inositol 1-phosphate cytidylyltransferase / CDP-L-myo-inositol myo-inositolphosphotransferase
MPKISRRQGLGSSCIVTEAPSPIEELPASATLAREAMSESTRDTPVGVILAAGTGARLNNACKPLTRVAGATLLERAVRTLREAGVKRVVVVVGHAGELVERFVCARSLDVELVWNADFPRGNGSSALVGGRAAGGRFLVTMADHIVDAAALTHLVACRSRFAAAVDSEPRYCDVAEATKVRLEGRRVVDLGHGLERFDAVDAGMFVCDSDLLQVAERSLADGGGSWNAVKRRCIAEGHRVEAVDLHGAFWIDIDTPQEARRAERLLVERAAAKRADGPVARQLNRRLSRPLSLLLIRLGVSPTAVTIACFLLTLAAAAALALGSLWPLALIAGGVLVQLASVVDGVDGEIARASLRASPYGGFLDSVLDRAGDAAVLVGLALGAGLDTASYVALAAALFGTLQVPYIRASYEAAFARPLPASLYHLGAGRDVRLFLIAVFAIALQPFLGLAVTAALANLEAARRFAAGWQARESSGVGGG